MTHNASVTTAPATAPNSSEGAQEPGLPTTQSGLEKIAPVEAGHDEGSEKAMSAPSPEETNQEKVVERVVVEEKVSTVAGTGGIPIFWRSMLFLNMCAELRA